MISTPYLEGDYIYGVDSYGHSVAWTPRRAIAFGKTGLPYRRPAGPQSTWCATAGGRGCSTSGAELPHRQLSPQGFREISRAKLLEPTTEQLRQRNGVCWSHPAYANKHISPATTVSWSAPAWQRGGQRGSSPPRTRHGQQAGLWHPTIDPLRPRHHNRTRRVIHVFLQQEYGHEHKLTRCPAEQLGRRSIDSLVRYPADRPDDRRCPLPISRFSSRSNSRLPTPGTATEQDVWRPNRGTTGSAS